MEMRQKQIEAAQAGRTEEANRYNVMLTHQVVAYKKGREFVRKVTDVKRAMTAAQAQGSPQPHESAPNPGTGQHPMPTVSATQHATPPTNPLSTPQLATPRQAGIALNQNPMSAMNLSPSNVNSNSGASAGSGSPRVFNPAAMQIPSQVGLGGVSAPVHGAPPPNGGHSHNNSVGQQPAQMPPNIAAQIKKPVEQHGPLQGNQSPGISGNGAGRNAGASLATAGGFGERVENQWSGTLVWQGTTRNEKKELRAQIVAKASKGNACVFFSMDILRIEDLFSLTHSE